MRFGAGCLGFWHKGNAKIFRGAVESGFRTFIETYPVAYNGCKVVKRMRIAGKSLGSGRIPIFWLFMAGVAAGILAVHIGESILLKNTGLFDEEVLYHMKYMSVDSNALFCYVLRKRLAGFLIFAVLATTYLGLVLCVGAVVWYGAAFGAFLAVLVLRYGLKGVLLAAATLFPQYLLYLPALIFFLMWCESTYRSIYHRGGLGEETERKGQLFKKLGQLAAILGVTAAGCVLEGYVNPRILTGFLKIF